MLYKTLRGLIAALTMITSGYSAAYTSPDTADGLEITQTALTQTGNRLYGWQGFEHEWLRYVIFRDHGRVPHRISRLHNYIDLPGEQFHFAQSTGVDGNYMRPRGYYALVESASLQIQQGSVSMGWTDYLTEGPYPVANNSIRHQLEIPLEQLAYEDNVHINLQGIKLDLHCDDNKQPANQPCNSDGMWPYYFRIEMGECTRTADSLLCDAMVDINRAWSPNRGGFQLFPLINEVKPLNERLDYQLELIYSVVSAHRDELLAQPTEEHHASGDLHQKEPYSGIVEHNIEPGTYQTSVTLIKGFSFMLGTPDTIQPFWTMLGSDTGHRGRYIGKMNFSVRDTDRHPADGTYSFEYSMGLWSPITVVDSALNTTLKTQTLLFAGPEVQSSANQVTGRLCINSTDQAPAFSRWEFCDLTHWLARWIYGGRERLTDAIHIGD